MWTSSFTINFASCRDAHLLSVWFCKVSTSSFTIRLILQSVEKLIYYLSDFASCLDAHLLSVWFCKVLTCSMLIYYLSRSPVYKRLITAYSLQHETSLDQAWPNEDKKSHTNVTSRKSSSSRISEKAEVMLEWKSFHRRQNCSVGGMVEVDSRRSPIAPSSAHSGERSSRSTLYAPLGARA